jgi:serine/threonine protein kinase
MSNPARQPHVCSTIVPATPLKSAGEHATAQRPDTVPTDGNCETLPPPQDAVRADSDGTRLKTTPPPALLDPSLPQVPGYDLLALLGRGGMGVVYQARHQKLQRLVALKMIRGGATAGPEELERFRTEAEAIARLQHPHIV